MRLRWTPFIAFTTFFNKVLMNKVAPAFTFFTLSSVHPGLRPGLLDFRFIRC